jgi:hypothetical protein
MRSRNPRLDMPDKFDASDISAMVLTSGHRRHVECDHFRIGFA